MSVFHCRFVNVNQDRKKLYCIQILYHCFEFKKSLWSIQLSIFELYSKWTPFKYHLEIKDKCHPMYFTQIALACSLFHNNKKSKGKHTEKYNWGTAVLKIELYQD